MIILAMVRPLNGLELTITDGLVAIRVASRVLNDEASKESAEVSITSGRPLLLANTAGLRLRRV